MPRKQKQKQKQSQRQSVVVNIHEKKEKKRRPHRKKRDESLPLPPPVVLGLPKVPPILIQYSEPASLQAPPPPIQQPVAQPAIAAPQVPQRFEEPVKGAFAESRPKTPAKSMIDQFKERRMAALFAQKIKQEPGFETPPRAEEIQKRIPPSFQEITQQPPREETLAESLPQQVASGGGASVRRQRASPTFTYPRREIVIREIVRNSDKFNAAQLKIMDTKDLRDIYDSLGLFRK